LSQYFQKGFNGKFTAAGAVMLYKLEILWYLKFNPAVFVMPHFRF